MNVFEFSVQADLQFMVKSARHSAFLFLAKKFQNLVLKNTCVHGNSLQVNRKFFLNRIDHFSLDFYS